MIEPAAADQATFEELCGFLLPMAKEVAIQPFDFRVARENGWRALSEGMTFVYRDRTGPIMGTIGMVKTPLWYAAWPLDYMLLDSWFYVAPEHRGGVVGKALLRTAQAVGRKLGKPTFVRVVNAKRREKLLRLV